MRKSKKNNSIFEKRTEPHTLPKGDVADFVPPEIIKYNKYHNDDLALILQLESQLISSGVVSDETAELDVTDYTEEAVTFMFDEANKNAVHERDYNPEFYDNDSDNELENAALNMVDDFENPLLDEVDDEDAIMYDYGNEDSLEGDFPHKTYQSESFLPHGHVRIRLEDGSEVTGEFILDE